MSDEIILIITISTIIFSSPLISKLIKVPVIPIEIFLGSVAAYIGFISSNHTFELVAELGFLYLMFLAGLEVDLKQLFKVSPTILKKGVVYSLMLYVLAIIISFAFDLSKIFIVTMPLISIGLLAALKKEYGNLPWINLAITIGLIGEIIAIIVLTAVSAGLEFGLGTEFYSTLIKLSIVFVIMVVFYYFFHNLIWWKPSLKDYLMPQNDSQEQDIRVSMGIFFLMVAAMIHLHLEVALGAFMAGVFIKTFFEHNKLLPSKLEHFGFGWLVPIFFIWIGSSFNLESIFMEKLIQTALMITGFMIFIRVASSMVFLKDLGAQKTHPLALSHSMPSIYSLPATLAFKTKA